MRSCEHWQADFAFFFVRLFGFFLRDDGTWRLGGRIFLGVTRGVGKYFVLQMMENF